MKKAIINMIGKHKKKLLIVAASLIVFLGIYTVVFQWYFPSSGAIDYSPEKITEKHIRNLENDNAAKYYLRACQAIDDSTWTDSFFERYNDVLENGWRKEEPEVEGYLAKNEPALELVGMGIQQDFCSMPTDDPFFGLSYLGGCRELSRLMLAKAGQQEWRGEYGKAARTYSDLLRFSADVSDNGMVLQALVGPAMEGLAYQGLESYLAGLSDESICRRLLDDLVDIEQGRAAVHDVLENEFASTVRFLEDAQREMFFTGNLPDDPGPLDYFVDTAQRSIGHLMFALYLPRYQRQAGEFNTAMLEVSQKPYLEIFGEKVEDRLVTNELSRIWFDMYYGFIHTSARHETIRRGHIIGVALHLHNLEHGKYPENIQELAATVPEEILIDPFSEQRFVYAKTDTGYLLYSLGGDMDDDGGKADQPPWNLETDGDIVFEPPMVIPTPQA